MVSSSRCPPASTKQGDCAEDRKSTRLNSSHVEISYAVFCLKKADAAGVQAPHLLGGVIGFQKHSAQSFKAPSPHPYRRKLREQVGSYPSSRTGVFLKEYGKTPKNPSFPSPTLSQ